MFTRLTYITILVLAFTGAKGQGLVTFDQLMSHSFTKTDSLELQILQAEKDYVLKDRAIRINSSAGTNEFGDLETGNIFRIKTGLEWNLLNEGYRDRKLAGKISDIDIEIENYLLKEESFDRNYGLLYNHIIYCFNKEKLKYLKEKEYLLEILVKKYEALYHSHAIEYQPLLVLLEQRDEASILTLALESYNQHYEQIIGEEAPELMPNYLPILSIDSEELLAFQTQDTTFEYLRELKLEKNDLEMKKERRNRLAIYNNVYWRPLQETGSNRYLYNGFGVRFSTHLSNRKKEREKLNDLHDQLDIQKNNEIRFNEQKELSNHLLAYHLKLRTYTRFAYKLKGLNEDKRLDHVTQLVSTSSPQSDIQQHKIDLDRLSVEYELLELKQQMYLLLLKIFKTSNVPSLIPYLREKDIKREHLKLKGDRVLLLAGDYPSVSEHNFIVEYLRKNEFYNLVLRQKQEKRPNKAFVERLEKEGFRVYPNLEALSYREIIEVPLDQFTNRVEFEYWIEDHIPENQNVYFLINDMNRLLSIDSYVLAE